MTQAEIDALNATLLANAQKPQSASVDGTAASQHPLRDQWEIAASLAGQVAATKPHFGLRFTKLIPPECG